jgi:DNA primase
MSNFKDILSELGYQLQDCGSHWRSKAIYRGGDNPSSLQISKKDGSWNDFASDSYGSFRKLVELSGGSLNGVNLEGETHELSEPDYHIDLKYPRIFDPSLLDKLTKNHSYWTKRGISKKTIEEFGGGYCSSGIMMGRYVFPIFDENKNILGFSGRDVSNKSSIKWKHVGAKSLWFYPLFQSREEIKKSNNVIVLESIGDMLKLWDNGIKNTIVAFGINRLEHLIFKIIELDPQKIIISFNNDEKSGENHGRRASISFARNLAKYFNRDKIKIILPKGKNDFGDMNKEEIKEWNQTVKKYLI